MNKVEQDTMQRQMITLQSRDRPSAELLARAHGPVANSVEEW